MARLKMQTPNRRTSLKKRLRQRSNQRDRRRIMRTIQMLVSQPIQSRRPPPTEAHPDGSPKDVTHLTSPKTSKYNFPAETPAAFSDAANANSAREHGLHVTAEESPNLSTILDPTYSRASNPESYIVGSTASPPSSLSQPREPALAQPLMLWPSAQALKNPSSYSGLPGPIGSLLERSEGRWVYDLPPPPKNAASRAEGIHFFRSSELRSGVASMAIYSVANSAFETSPLFYGIPDAPIHEALPSPGYPAANTKEASKAAIVTQRKKAKSSSKHDPPPRSTTTRRRYRV